RRLCLYGGQGDPGHDLHSGVAAVNIENLADFERPRREPGPFLCKNNRARAAAVSADSPPSLRECGPLWTRQYETRVRAEPQILGVTMPPGSGGKARRRAARDD